MRVNPQGTPKVAFLVPGVAGGLGMIHAKKLIEAVRSRDVLQVRVDYLSPGFNPIRLAAEILRVWRNLRTYRPDVVHGQFGGKTGLVTVLVALLVGARSVVHFRGSDLNPSQVDGWLRSSLMNLASQVACLLADHRIFVSRGLVERVWFPGWMRNAFHVEPSGHDETIFFPGDRAKARLLLGLGEGEPVLAFVAGAIPAVKGEHLVLQAVERLRALAPVRFVSVGGDWAPERVAALMNAADCLIFASRYEGSPCVIQEALACGLPVVSVDVGDVREISEGTGAVDVVARDPAALAAAVAARLARPARVETPEVVARSGFAAAAPRYVELYQRLGAPAHRIAGRLFRSVSWTAAGNVISSAATLLATMGLARVLGPGPFGEFGLVQNTLGFFILLVGPSLGLTATKYVAELRNRDVERLARVLRLAMGATYAITTALAVILLVGSSQLAIAVLKAPEVVAHLRVAALALVLMMVNGVQVGVLSGFEAFRGVAIVNAVRGVTVLPAFWLGARWGGSLGAVWGLTCSWGLACLAGALFVRGAMGRGGIPLRAVGAWEERRILVSHSLPGWVGGLLVGTANWIGSVILARQPDGIAQTGVLAAANQFFLLLMFLPQVLGQAGIPLMMEREGANDPGGADRVFRRLVFLNLGATLPGAAILAAFASVIMERLGAGFAPYRDVLVVSVATAPLYALSQAGIQRVMSQSRMWTSAAVHLAYFAAFVGAALAWRASGATGFAGARFVAYAIAVAAVFLVMRGVRSPAAR